MHRRLLEERVEELQAGAVLLLKQVDLLSLSERGKLTFFTCGSERVLAFFPRGQVGVFSPSHRNHYLNVTPNNLLRIYSPDGVALASTQPLPLVPVRAVPARTSHSSGIMTKLQAVCVCLVSRSRTPPPPSGSPYPRCSCSLTRRTREDGRLPQTGLTEAPQEAFRSPGTRLCCTPAGSWVRTER